MTEGPVVAKHKRNIWIRGLIMLLMGIALNVSGTVLGFVAILQFILTLINDTPNVRLVSFGRSLGNYLQQIVNFMTFATEEVPFPFNEWPDSE